MDKSWKYKIIANLRRLTRYYPPRNAAKNAIKIAPEVYKCPICSRTIYAGKRSIDAINLKYPEAIAGKIDVDHINPVIRLDGVEPSWDDIINTMFCDVNNLQAMCSECHKKKTKEEANLRKINKKNCKNS